MQFQNTKLANGLEIIAECNDNAHTSALGFFIKTGARDEHDEVSGVSHFLEHMVFKGTARRSADEVNLEFDRMGADYNAYTSEESTVYHANILPEFQDRTVELLGDIMRPALRDEDFDSEKKVIIEEIMMYADQPPYGADDKCRAVFFGEHPLGRSVLGTAESVAALTSQQMRDYWRSRYNPSNITLVAAGKIDFDRLVKTANQVCGGWEPGPAARQCPALRPRAEFELMHKEQANQEYLIGMTAAPQASDRQRFAAKAVAVIVGDDTGSRLYWELVDQGLAEHASLHYYGYEDAGAFFTYLCCEPDDAAKNLAIVRKIYVDAETRGITPEELRQAQSKFASRIVLGSERPRGRLFVVGSHWQYRREYRSVAEDLQTVRDVTVEECNQLMRDYPLTGGTMLAVGPLTEMNGQT